MQFNDYQVVIISNTVRTFVIFTYICGGIQWSALGTNAAAVVGYNIRGDFFNNHPLSGFQAIGEAVSCTITLGRRQKRQSSPMGVGANTTNGMMTEIPNNNVLSEQVQSCLDRSRMDNILFTLTAYVDTNLTALADQLDPCPCSYYQAKQDFGRFVPQANTTSCFVSANPITISLFVTGNPLTLTQQCCYEDFGYVTLYCYMYGTCMS